MELRGRRIERVRQYVLWRAYLTWHWKQTNERKVGGGELYPTEQVDRETRRERHTAKQTRTRTGEGANETHSTGASFLLRTPFYLSLGYTFCWVLWFT